MHRALIVSVSLLVASGSAVADDAAAPPTATVVDAKKPVRAAAAAAAHTAAQPRKSSEAPTETNAAPGNETTPGKPQGDVQMSGMSVLGNDDTPKSLALVPWKTSQLGDAPSISKLLDDSTQPVDKEVFMRELAYYEIKTDSK
jgi:hypothetical protein